MSTNDLHVLSESPLNVQPSLAELIKHPITPTRLIYVRNHAPIKDFEKEPGMNPETFTIKIDGDVPSPATLNLKDLIVFFRRQEIVAALQCAGNRRTKMVEKTHEDVEGIKWNEGVIANVRWAGVPLRAVLRIVGIPESITQEGNNVTEFKDEGWKNMHVCFASHASPCEQASHFGVSIPMTKAMDENGDVLLAYEMDDQPLPIEHGFPLRLVVPGYNGVRWIKWVDHIYISRQESQNFYQQRDYKVLPENVTSQEMASSENWWSSVPALQTLTLNSVVATVEQISSSPPRTTILKNNTGSVALRATGYALSSNRVTAVEISADSGATWVPAKITYQEGRWSWTLWEGEITANLSRSEDDEGPMDGISGRVDGILDGGNMNDDAGKHVVTVWSRAKDESGDVQVSECAWNLRGMTYCGPGEGKLEV